MKKGFTLAEIMIVLAVIGILTAVLLPVAINSSPNEDIMKFKKGHNALLSAIRELVNSDKYYLDGDLGIRADGQLLDGTHDGDYSYFCKTLADIISTKSDNCDTETNEARTWIDLYPDGTTTTEERYEAMATWVDDTCTAITEEAGVITDDKINFFESNTKAPFGISIKKLYETVGIESPYDDSRRQFGGYYPDPENPTIDPIYKIFCMDIDGINEGEDPFGYGIRADGKVFFGAKANEWLQKSIQEKE